MVVTITTMVAGLMIMAVVLTEAVETAAEEAAVVAAAEAAAAEGEVEIDPYVSLIYTFTTFYALNSMYLN